MTRRTGPSVVYLIHFERRYKHAGHYLGSTKDLPARLRAHAHGDGARLMAVITEAGIGWQLARTWEGGRARERQIKRQGGLSRCCPLCGVTPRPAPLSRNRDGSLSRSRTSDTEKTAAGAMTSAQWAEHTALRRGAAAGKVPGIVRLAAVPADDPWYAAAS
jgi:predicted GIY-YIG superfamily endonuclease